jgi:hypothetical protein
MGFQGLFEMAFKPVLVGLLEAEFLGKGNRRRIVQEGFINDVVKS